LNTEIEDGEMDEQRFIFDYHQSSVHTIVQSSVQSVVQSVVQFSVQQPFGQACSKHAFTSNGFLGFLNDHVSDLEV